MTALKDAPLSGTIRYNDFTFGSSGGTPPTYRLRGVPVYDGSKRTVTHVRYTLDVSTIIYSDSQESLGQQMLEVRQQLTRPSRKLEILDIGLGNTTVDDGGSHPDVLWGVKPQVISLEPVGGTLAWQLQWRCEFNVGETSTRRPTSGKWLAMNFQTEYGIDQGGFTSRTIRGYVQVVQVGQDNNASRPRRTVDQARDRVQFAVPENYRRLRTVWTESTDKSRLDFLVVDEELRTDPFPPGIIDAEVDFEVENRTVGFPATAATLNGYMETAHDVPKSLAVARAFTIAQDRMQRLQSSSGLPRGAVVVPSSVSIKRQLFGRRTSFSFQFQVANCLNNLLLGGGILEPLPGSDYRQWRISVEHLWGNRGKSGLKSNVADAAIVDLLDNPTSAANLGTGGTTTTTMNANFAPPSLTPVVTQQASWLDYRVRVRAMRDENVSIHRLSQEVDVSNASESDGVGAPFRNRQTQIDYLRETHGPPIQQILFEGVAARLNYRPTAAVLSRVGGQTVTERSRTQELSQVGSYCNMPVYQLRWSILYDVSGYVSRLDPPRSPLVGKETN